MREKMTEQLKIHLPESLIRDIQDEAMDQDRSVSEFVRHVLATYLYGSIGQRNRQDQGATRGR